MTHQRFPLRTARLAAALLAATAVTMTLAGRPAAATDDGTPMLTVEVDGCNLSFVLGPSLPDDAVLGGFIGNGSFQQPASPGTTVTFVVGQDIDPPVGYAYPIYVVASLTSGSSALASVSESIAFTACPAVWPGTSTLHLSAVASGNATVDSVGVTIRVGDGSVDGCASPRGVVTNATIPLTGATVDVPVASYFMCVFVDEVPGAESVTVAPSRFVEAFVDDGNLTRTIEVAFAAPASTNPPDTSAPPAEEQQQPETPAPETSEVGDGTLPPTTAVPAVEPPAFEPTPTAQLPATGANATLAVFALVTIVIGAAFVWFSRRRSHPTGRFERSLSGRLLRSRR